MRPQESTIGIDFRALTLCDALDLALTIEEEARDRYVELADQLAKHHTPEAAEFFLRMSRIEEKHRGQLEERRRAVFGDAPKRVGRTMIFDIEAPEYDEARAFMGVQEALGVALRCEEKAHAFFAEVLEHVHEPELRALFEELAQDELHHQDLVRAEMVRLPADDPGRADDYCDPPAPQ